MKKVLGLFVVLAVARVAQAADIEAGKELVATVCAGCHGASGVSVSDAIPNLAAQRPAYIEAQLKAFKDGTRKHLGATSNIMNVIQLSAQDIANVAAYFASQPWPSTTPPANVSYTSTLKQLAEAKVINLKARQDARSNDPLNAAYGSRRGDRIATHDDCTGEMSAMTKCGHWVEKR